MMYRLLPLLLLVVVNKSALSFTVPAHSSTIQKTKHHYIHKNKHNDGNLAAAASTKDAAMSNNEQEEEQGLTNELLEKISLLKKEEEADQTKDAASIIDVSKYDSKKEEIKKQIQQLETSFQIQDNDINRFEPILGLYEVTHVQTANPKDNPVGGRWTRKRSGLFQRLFRPYHMPYQHVLATNTTGVGQTMVEMKNGITVPVVAEAINVISLEFNGPPEEEEQEQENTKSKTIKKRNNKLWWWLPHLILTVVLRGDAIPLSSIMITSTPKRPVLPNLSNLAVKVLFDSPRISIRRIKNNDSLSKKNNNKWWSIHVGPKTAVILDTTYLDQKIRLGKGGTSGTNFVFTRQQQSKNNNAIMEFQSILNQRPISKPIALLSLATMFWACIYGIIRYRGIFTINATLASLIAMTFVTITFSGGGIERNDRSIGMRRQIDSFLFSKNKKKKNKAGSGTAAVTS